MKRSRTVIGIAAAAVVVLLVMQIMLLQRISSLEQRLAETTTETQRELADIVATQAQLRERTNSTEASVLGLQNSLLELETESATRLEGLQGQIQESRESIQGLENRIVDVSSEDFSGIIGRLLESTVSVRTNTGVGSGVIVDEEGHVLTNYHVVRGITSGSIRTSAQQRHAFRIVAADPTHDLALLRITGNRTFAALEFEESASVQVGTRVIALGSPAGLDFTVTEGIVSAVDRQTPYGDYFVQTDVPINPGNSGGPLVNINGRIVGINTFKSRGYEGLGFAVDSDTAREFVEQALAAAQD